MNARSMFPRSFLFLQGPPGPFFWLLAQELSARGHDVHRINFNGGDKVDWPGKAVNYRGPQSGWNQFFDHYVRDHGITDILLFGDCRPLHRAAQGMATLRGVAIHVFEEGYIRPHWMTMEPEGVNGNSTLPRDPQWLVRQAAGLPPLPKPIAIQASFGRRVKDTLRYYTHDCLSRWQYPFYTSHRPGSLLIEGGGWLFKFARQRLHRKHIEQAIAQVGSAPYFLFPLQLNSDYQIRSHSPFTGMYEAALYVIESFAHHAPGNTMLVVKEHPLDCSYRSWSRYIRKHARRLGIEDRVLHIAGGGLDKMAEESLGIVTVNSTSGTLGLAVGTPVFVLGQAVYDIAGITHQGKLDEFWTAPTPPDKTLYDAFCRVLHARCLISGGIASQSAIAILVESALKRLLNNPALISRKENKSRVVIHHPAINQPASSAASTSFSSTGA
ncbi:MAG: capsular biosynthesis protein [Sphingobium sp.]|nr:capsular biosynthesis protein [Sphingobium sp.]